MKREGEKHDMHTAENNSITQGGNIQATKARANIYRLPHSQARRYLGEGGDGESKKAKLTQSLINRESIYRVSGGPDRRRDHYSLVPQHLAGQ